MLASKSRLGRRNDCKFSQPLGVEFVDYSPKKSEASAESYMRSCEVTTPITPFISKENVPSDNQIMAEPCVRKKTRRSMLGQRSKLQNLDSVLNRSRNLACNGIEEEGIDEVPNVRREVKELLLDIPTPNEKNMMKPLYSSSPRSDVKSELRLLSNKPETREPITPPNPFQSSGEVNSKFFESGIRNIDPWSVFKTGQGGIKSPEASLNFESQERSTRPDSGKNKKSFKTKLFNESNKKSLQSSSSGNKTRRSTANSFKASSFSNTRAASVPRVKSPKCSSEISHDYEYNINSDVSNDIQTGNINSFQYSNEDDEDDCFAENESTIRAMYERSSASKPKLSVICEEDNKNKQNSNSSLIDGSDKASVSSQESATSSDDVNKMKKDFKAIQKQWLDTQKRSNAIDKLLEDLINEKKLFNSDSENLNYLMEDFKKKYKFDITLSEDLNRQRKHFISSETKPNPVLILSPDNILKSPCNNRIKPRKSNYLQSYSELRQGFPYLKTPDQRSCKKRLARGSVCYTPNSLSICLAEQLRGLDSAS